MPFIIVYPHRVCQCGLILVCYNESIMDMDIKSFISASIPPESSQSSEGGKSPSGGIKLLVIVAIVVLIVGVVWYYPTISRKNITREEEAINKQVEELDNLRKQAGVKTYSEKELQAQSKELDAMRQTIIGSDGKPVKVESKPLTEAEIKQQIDELDALRKR